MQWIELQAIEIPRDSSAKRLGRWREYLDVLHNRARARWRGCYTHNDVTRRARYTPSRGFLTNSPRSATKAQKPDDFHGCHIAQSDSTRAGAGTQLETVTVVGRATAAACRQASHASLESPPAPKRPSNQHFGLFLRLVLVLFALGVQSAASAVQRDFEKFDAEPPSDLPEDHWQSLRANHETLTAWRLGSRIEFLATHPDDGLRSHKWQELVAARGGCLKECSHEQDLAKELDGEPEVKPWCTDSAIGELLWTNFLDVVEDNSELFGLTRTVAKANNAFGAGQDEIHLLAVTRSTLA